MFQSQSVEKTGDQHLVINNVLIRNNKICYYKL